MTIRRQDGALSIEPVRVGGFWGWRELVVDDPWLARDDFWFARFTVQNGRIEGDTLIPAGQHGGRERAFTDASRIERTARGRKIVLPRHTLWTVPTDANTVFRIRVYEAFTKAEPAVQIGGEVLIDFGGGR